MVPSNQLPKALKQAILSVEDSRFYHHSGIDIFGITRALITDIRAGYIVEGGSTITQQLTKILFLTPEKNISRKIKEAMLALLIESKYTKDEILEIYCNQMYLGSGTYGVEAAAQTYFGKPVKDLNLAEAALISGLFRAPTRFSPFNDLAAARKRMNHALRRMIAEGYISRQEAAEAKETPINLNYEGRYQNKASYFAEYIRQYLEKKYGSNILYRAGLKVHTTLDLKLQAYAERSIENGLREIDKRRGFRGIKRDERNGKNHLWRPPQVGDVVLGEVIEINSQYIRLKIGGSIGSLSIKEMGWARIKDPTKIFHLQDKVWTKVLAVNEVNQIYELALEQDPEVEGALVALEPHTGHIKAMVGGYNFEKSQFNRVVQAKRQPGSAFKPFIYLTALSSGFTPADIILDAPVSYYVPGMPRVWRPKNYSNEYYGPNTLRKALENSRNVSTVRLLNRIGVNPVIETAQKMGLLGPFHPNLSLALGASEVTLLELTKAYGVLANQGVTVEPIAIRRITDSDGKILEENYPLGSEVLKRETAYLLTNVLKGVITRGTGRKARVLDRPVAGKTGTTNDYQDAWFIGFTPHLVAGVWVGLDDHGTIGNKETGARAALPIWLEFMQKALALEPKEDFIIPQGITFVKIDPETGLLATDACPKILIESFLKGSEPTTPCHHGRRSLGDTG
jgi:penicillin-binding protein 1A